MRRYLNIYTPRVLDKAQTVVPTSDALGEVEIVGVIREVYPDGSVQIEYPANHDGRAPWREYNNFPQFVIRHTGEYRVMA